MSPGGGDGAARPDASGASAAPGEQPVVKSGDLKPVEHPTDAKYTSVVIPSSLCFPLEFRPKLSYHQGKDGGARYFGARRSGGRRIHAACDLIAPVKTPILAMKDGVVLSYYYFYEGTYALEVDHGDFLARYGEVGSKAAGLKSGTQVKKGQVIAFVGRLKSGSSMLHLELYSKAAAGPLTVRANRGFQRRKDLMNPTDLLDRAKLRSAGPGTPDAGAQPVPSDALNDSMIAAALCYNQKQGDSPQTLTKYQSVIGATASGHWDRETVERLGDFQRRHGLEVDGKLGPHTRDVLQSAVAEGTCC